MIHPENICQGWMFSLNGLNKRTINNISIIPLVTWMFLFARKGGYDVDRQVSTIKYAAMSEIMDVTKHN